jgi:YYY domain-containing protein
VAGTYLRLQKVNWDHGHLAHPDERHVLMVTDTVEWPESLAQALDVRSSPLNPFSRPGEGGIRTPQTFAYGHLPVYLLKVAAAGAEALARPLGQVLGADSPLVQKLSRMTGLWEMAPLGRVISALFDAGTILVTYALARRLFGPRAGLLAAGLFSFTVLHVQLSHFYAVDTMLAFFVTLTLYWLVRVAQGGGTGAAIWAGVSLALAVASKSSAAALGLAWILAFVLRKERADSLRLAGLSFFAGAVAFMLVSPYVVLDLRMFLDSFDKESRMVRGIYDFPYTRQYRGTPAFLYTLQQQLRWGMGWLPGLVAFAGLGWGAYRMARGRASAGTVVVLAWAVPYFLITGSFMVKFMRYAAPLNPALYVLGAGLVAAIATRRRWLAWGLGGLALAYAVLWSVAFSSIYQRPFTRHEASEWIYRNLPAGSVITAEEWDDVIPYGMMLDGTHHWAEGQYEVISFPFQEPDDRAKVDMLVDRLQRADYIIVSSNRFYGWLPRLQDRFPVSNRYYELLFSGQLGFELIREFTSYPTLGPLTFVDDKADESFTVYDHPKVMVFERTATLTEGEIRALFEPYLGRLAWAGGKEELLLPGPVDEYPSTDDFGWNRLAYDGPAAAIWWWLVATVVGLVAWPLAHRLLGGLWGGGWPLARVIGLALVAYPVWLGASLGVTGNSVWALLGALGLLALSGIVMLVRRRQAWRAFLRARWREIALAEAAALAAYLVWTGVRVLNPDLWHPWWGGERPMEMGFFLAVLKSGRFPPYDPFYAGGYINYYYYGLYLVAALTKLSGIRPEVAFNLALSLFFSLTFSSAMVLGASLVRGRAVWAGLASAVLVTVLGNLEGGLLLIRRWAEAGADAPGGSLALVGWVPQVLGGLAAVLSGQRPAPAYDFWIPSRVIPDTINEFPFFSFLYGDLHPHILDMPVILTTAAVVYCLFGRGDEGRSGWVRWGRLGLLGLLVGTAVATNTWDAPALVAVGLGAVVLFWAREGGPGGLLRARAVAVIAAAGLGVALFLPFLRLYQPPPGGFALSEGGSPLLHFLRVWGLFGFLSLALSLEVISEGRYREGPLGFLALGLRRWRQLPRLLDLVERAPGPRQAGVAAGLILLGLVAITGGLVLAGRAAGAVALALALVSGLAAVSARERGTAFAQGLMALAWMVLLGTELFYLKDWLAGGAAYRMNTVFKFGIQAWLLLGVACGAVALRHAGRPRGAGALGGWRLAALGLACLAAVYPLLGTPTRVSNRFPNAQPARGTLDGLAYMSVGAYFWPDEFHPIALAPEQEALNWLRDNVTGTPVVAEAALGYYREGGSRVAAYTGLPIPLGPQHEAEQRPKAPIGTRHTLVTLLYESADPYETLQLIEELGVSYVYVGQLERIVHGEQVTGKFAAMAAAGQLARVFANDEVAIYAVPGGAES